MTYRRPSFKDPHDAFERAIQAGALSREPDAERYAGNYMYMGTWGGTDYFKHILTRRYLYVHSDGRWTNKL
jgi:hypothetical protein